ncbi:hypothetical protein GCM10027088_39770 [Nocardia goodfellowii]
MANDGAAENRWNLAGFDYDYRMWCDACMGTAAVAADLEVPPANPESGLSGSDRNPLMVTGFEFIR